MRLVRRKVSSPKRAAVPSPVEIEPVAHRASDHVFASIAAFVSGGCLMVLELVASRVLAPAFGNTVFLWTSVIGLILAALSVGYWLGGWLADRQPGTATLCAATALAGLFVGLIPLLSPVVLESMGAPGHGAISGPLVAAAALFLVPGILIGTISPMAVKLVSLGGTAVGHAAGRVSALGALGSIAGTFSTGFVLIPMAGNRAIIVGVAVTLVVLGVGGFVLAKQKLSRAQGLILLLAAGSCIAAASAEAESVPGMLFDRETFYHRVRVRDEEWGPRRVRILTLDTTPEGAMYLDGDRDELPFAYTQYIDLADLFVTAPRRAAFIGGGSYAMPKRFIRRHEGSTAEVYEVDPVVADVGRRFFGTDDVQGLGNRVGDARQLLRDGSGRFDLIFGDAYNGVRQIPFHLTTLEYYRLVHARLRLGGIYMTNIITAVAGPGAEFFQSTARTLLEVFPEVYAFSVGGRLDRSSNVILVCPVVPRGFSSSQIRDLGRGTPLEEFTDTIVDSDEYETGVRFAPILTDDHSPVESLVAG